MLWTLMRQNQIIPIDFNRWESITFNHYPLGKRSCGRGGRTFLIYHVIIKAIMALWVKALHSKWPLYQVGFFYIFTSREKLFCFVTWHHMIIWSKRNMPLWMGDLTKSHSLQASDFWGLQVLWKWRCSVYNWSHEMMWACSKRSCNFVGGISSS